MAKDLTAEELKELNALIPESVRLGLTAYVHNDRLDAGSHVSITGRIHPKAFDRAHFDNFVTAAVIALEEATGEPGWRPMTTAEVEAYRDDNSVRQETVIRERLNGGE